MSKDDGRPQGRPFRELYVAKGDRATESAPFRVRLSTYLSRGDRGSGEDFPFASFQLVTMFKEAYGYEARSLEDFVRRAPIELLLSFITVVYQQLISIAETATYQNRYREPIARNAASGLVGFVRTAFIEERLAFEIDDHAGVHPLVDAEFQQNRVSAIRPPRLRTICVRA